MPDPQKNANYKINSLISTSSAGDMKRDRTMKAARKKSRACFRYYTMASNAAKAFFSFLVVRIVVQVTV